MDFRFLLVLASCSLIVTKTKVSAQQKCCTEVAVSVRKEMLKRVKCYEVLEANGKCDLRAIMFHVGEKKLCADLNNKNVTMWMRTMKKKNLKPKNKKNRKRRKTIKC